MRAEFNYLNLHTIYKVEGKFKKDWGEHPCFRNAFCFNRDQNKGDKYVNIYHIKVWTNTTKNAQRYNNFTLVNIEKYLHYLQQVVPFEFSLEKLDDHVIMTITVNHYRYMHNYILCCVRYLYEFPYNMALSDAIQLFESGECPGLNIIDCFNLALATSDSTYSGEQVCLAHHCASKPMGYKEIVNMLFLYERNNNTCVKVSDAFSNKVTYERSGHIENHINTFYRRLPIYKSNYENYLKKYV